MTIGRKVVTVDFWNTNVYNYMVQGTSYYEL